MQKLIAVRALALALSFSSLGLLFMGTPCVQAESGVWPSGDEIVRRINARDEGEATSSTLLMELIDRRDQKRVWETRTFQKYYGEEKRTVIFYLNPKNVKDTAFLTFDYPPGDRDDAQWLYLPAFRKLRRISVANRGDYFLGTDFTYEDIKKGTRVGIEDYTWKTVGEETVDGYRCYVVEGVPMNQNVAKELGYGRVLSRVDAEIWMVRKTEVWDVHGRPLKTIFTRDIRKVQGIWTAHRIEVQNHKTEHRTAFTFNNVDYGNVDDDLFTERALHRGL